MPFRPETIRNRGYLPHWEAEGAMYSVTFRLGDSLPREVVERYERERREMAENAERMQGPMTAEEKGRLDFLYSEKIEQFLDQGVGACHLREPEVGKLVFEAIRHFHGTRYELYTWCVMPNHVHVLFRPEPPHTLAEILKAWKGFTLREANRMLGRSGKFWMAEYYDHMIRDEADFWRVHRYILENPGKAGLKGWLWVKTLVEERGGRLRD